MDYNLKDLEGWNNKIEEIAKSEGVRLLSSGI